MVNASKIRARMEELGITALKASDAMIIPEGALARKINNLSPFTLAQAEALASLLKLSDEEFGEYFFA